MLHAWCEEVRCFLCMGVLVRDYSLNISMVMLGGFLDYGAHYGYDWKIGSKLDLVLESCCLHGYSFSNLRFSISIVIVGLHVTLIGSIGSVILWVVFTYMIA